MSKPRSTSSAEVKRIGKFGAVGILNTLIDFTIFNLMSKFVLIGTSGVIPSNLISTTAAMIFSFFANKTVVFKANRGSLLRQAVIFFAVTGVGLYLIQTGVIFFLVHLWPAPLELVVRAIRHLGIHFFNDKFYINNGAKAAATIVSLTWNYVMYKKVVFR